MKIELQKKINEDILEIISLSDKYLESLYPPESNHLVDVSELLSDWFEFDCDSPYMLLVTNVNKSRRRQMTIEEKKLFSRLQQRVRRLRGCSSTSQHRHEDEHGPFF